MLLLDNGLALLVILWLQVSPFLLQFLVSHLAKLHLLVTLWLVVYLSLLLLLSFGASVDPVATVTTIAVTEL